MSLSIYYVFDGTDFHVRQTRSFIGKFEAFETRSVTALLDDHIVKCIIRVKSDIENSLLSFVDYGNNKV